MARWAQPLRSRDQIVLFARRYSPNYLIALTTEGKNGLIMDTRHWAMMMNLRR